MDVLSKKLDQGVIDGIFNLHPSCEAPLISHFSFADDILIFFDGSEESLRGILSILEDFRDASGLSINREKTELMIDGGCPLRCQALASAVGISQGELPVRYLGVPLSSKKMDKSDFQPLLDSIASRFNSWTARHLSFAGRFQLIQSVIYSSISFWASIFILPKQCIKELERLCNAFLWKGSTTSARGARIAWDSVCTPKETGGLGLKRIEDWNQVLGLKLIWMLFAAGGSLWVSWIKVHLIGASDFWDLDENSGGSWIWRSICKLRQLAKPFIICEVGSGITASFWKDNWTSLGPLIDLTGPQGPMVTGLPLQSAVVDALREDGWWLATARSRHPIITLLRDCLPDHLPILRSEDDDQYLWSTGIGSPKSRFSTEETWRALHPMGIQVPWH